MVGIDRDQWKLNELPSYHHKKQVIIFLRTLAERFIYGVHLIDDVNVFYHLNILRNSNAIGYTPPDFQVTPLLL